jgi:hypothetical protein
LNWYRQLIKLRRSNVAFYDGSYVSLTDSDPNIMAYLRKSPAAQVVVILNFSAQPQTIALDSSTIGTSEATVLLSTDRQLKRVNLKKVELAPYGVVIAKVLQRTHSASNRKH